MTPPLTRPATTEKRVAAGLKAAIHNPNVSEEAKERAQERLETMGTSVETTSRAPGGSYPVGSTDEAGHETNRVLGGYKATLHSESQVLFPEAAMTDKEDRPESERRGQGARARDPQCGRLPVRAPRGRDGGRAPDARQCRLQGRAKQYVQCTSPVIPWMLTRPSLDPRVSDEAKLHAEEYLQQHGGF